MNDFDVKEYNSVVLGALLHDVGKLIHRGTPGYEGKHDVASSDFIKDNIDKLRNLNDLYDIDLVRFLVRHHHSNNDKIEIELEKNGKSFEERKRILKLVKIVKDADSYSCIERDKAAQDKTDKDKRRSPLDSIFSYVNLDVRKVQEKSTIKYPLSPLNPLKSFPADINLLSDEEIKHLIKVFLDSIPDFSQYKNFDDVINVWLNLFEKYTWAVPSDTRYKIADISLFDHLKTSAAVSACLYKRHITEINDNKKTWKRQYEFIFAGGDFSGIQDYIFNITSNEAGGVSKRLRARSLFITLFSEIIIHRILHAFNLPFVCNLFSAGGKFLLIIPNIENTVSKLKELKKDIEEDIHRHFFSQFSFLLSCLDTKYFREDFEVRNFFRIADKMFHKLETEKLMKSKAVFNDVSDGKPLWNISSFRADDMYKSYKGNTDCKVCGKGPALFIDSDEDSKKVCCKCYIDRNVIGEILPKTKYIAFGKGIIDGVDDVNKIPVIRTSRAVKEDKKEFYYIQLLKKYRRSDDHYMLYKIDNENSDAADSSSLFLNRFLANHVPKDKYGNISDFEDIAKASIWEDNGKSRGSNLLGVLKADIDNLGLIFSKGFEIPGSTEKKDEEVDRKSVSRFLTLSRMIELFFSGWMKEVMSSKPKDEIIGELMQIKGVEEDRFRKYLDGDYINFKNIYTVYSGGDDLVLVGPWETMIIFAIYLNQQFRQYTCNNDFITLSAGLTFVKPKHPIASAIKEAETLLDESKEKGKDRITVFGTTVEWKQLPEMVNLFLFLNGKINEKDSNINPSFLYRLLEYHRMALNLLNDNKIEGLKYLSSLSYDIGRNIVEWNKKGHIIKGEEEYDFLQCFLNEKPSKNSLIYNVKISLFWALYRNRRSWIETENKKEILKEA